MRASAARKGAHGKPSGEEKQTGRQDGQEADGHRAGGFLAGWLPYFARIRRMLKCALTCYAGAGRIALGSASFCLLCVIWKVG